jgi:restriction system protein
MLNALKGRFEYSNLPFVYLSSITAMRKRKDGGTIYLMPIPDYQSVMLPLLRMASDSNEYSLREAVERMAEHFNLTQEEKTELLPSGQQFTFTNRVGWAVTYMKKAGLLESTRRSHFRITQRGLEALVKNPPAINVKFLKQYQEFIDFQTKRNDLEKPSEVTPSCFSQLSTPAARCRQVAAGHYLQ